MNDLIAITNLHITFDMEIECTQKMRDIYENAYANGSQLQFEFMENIPLYVTFFSSINPGSENPNHRVHVVLQARPYVNGKPNNKPPRKIL